MIVSYITGGLGNQLAMYAFGRAYAEKYGVEHFVDNASYVGYALHKYVLDRMAVAPNVITRDQLEAADIRNVLQEKRLRYNESIWNAGLDHLYISMYASDYRYSKPIIGKLREELSPMVPMTGEFKELYEEMRDGETVSMHVRLQDYLRNPHCLNLPITYYRDAVQVIANGASDLRVYLFTDEPDAVIKHGFNPGYPFTIISNGPERNLEDMSLMSACKHHIVANSSYSFWGAWLDGKGGGITVVPDLFHRPDGKQLADTYGEVVQPTYPDDWNVVKVRCPQSQT